jgi:parallel beta-helix repeat protein
VPRRNLVAFNRIATNASSGVYIDGAVENVLFDNLIEANSKEGICLDYGATANVVAMNQVRLNGKRWARLMPS